MPRATPSNGPVDVGVLALKIRRHRKAANSGFDCGGEVLTMDRVKPKVYGPVKNITIPFFSLQNRGRESDARDFIRDWMT